MPIDVIASAPHYVDHAVAVYGALAEASRGSIIAPHGPVAERVRGMGYEPTTRGNTENPTLVASFGDLGRAVAQGRTRIAMMEHGAGQSYGGRPQASRHGSYAGGQGRGAASLFLHPGNHPAERDRRAYPDARVEVVGSPILDTLPQREGDRGRVVAFSFHFNSPLAPEAKNALPWAWPAILKLRDQYQLLGHAHPRLFDKVRRQYLFSGIEPVREFADVCRAADLYICDNSSSMFAFAATGRPVVVLNPPWYDRKVDHGLRFWDAADVGVQCNDPAELGACIERAFRDTATTARRRERALDAVYAYRTGAAARAAAVLEDWAA